MEGQTDILCEFPIKFLQDNYHGIMKEDLIMIAAGSGTGKSSWSRMLLRQALKERQGVVFFSLEDAEGTFAKKSAHQLYCAHTAAPMDYRQFKNIYNNYPDRFVEERKEVAQFMYTKDKRGKRGLVLFEMKTPKWTIEEVIEEMKRQAENGYKLFILDHFDKVVDDRVQAQAKAIDDLWDFVSLNKIALITFSQLKGTRNQDALCPGIEDLNGSKGKVRTPTMVISLARHEYGRYSEYPGKPTYCRVLKDRDNGDKRCAIIFYENDSYLSHYVPVDSNESGTRIDGETRKTLEKTKA